MCGITGYTTPGRWDRDVLDAMTRALTHRGPDSRGTLHHGEVALGHRRLAVLDLSPNAAQPMESPDGEVALVYNGECYNHPDLRRAMDGVKWRGTSDTETLLHLYMREGPIFIDRVNGMFALAVHDRRARKLHLYRDRMGEKPLYYAHDGHTLLFASELKSLLRHPAFNRELDSGALTEYLLYNYIPGPRTIFRHCRKLPPATHLTFDLESGGLEMAHYWELPRPRVGAGGRTRAEARDELEELLLDSVRRRTLSDVPLGCFLSGGIDSSAVAWALGQVTTGTPRTFTIGFEDADYDESPHAAAVARHLGTEHHCEKMTADQALRLLPNLPALCDEPFADASLLPTALLCRETRKHVTVALSGDGGDELFLGYDRYRWAETVRRRVGAVPGPLRRAGMGVLGRLPHYRLQTMAAGLRFSSRAGIYPYVYAGWSAPLAARVLARPVDFERERIHALYRDARHTSLSASAGYTDLRMYLPDDILAKVDKASMACSLEARVPFLDHRFVEFAQSIPAEWKMKGASQKRLLRAVLFRHVPEHLFNRPKAGFAVPLKRWFRGRLKRLLAEQLSPERLATHGLFDAAAVSGLLRRHQSGRYNHERVLWALLVFQLWHGKYLE